MERLSSEINANIIRDLTLAGFTVGVTIGTVLGPGVGTGAHLHVGGGLELYLEQALKASIHPGEPEV